MSMNLFCNLMQLIQTPTEVTWELMKAADPQSKQSISSAKGRAALSVLEAYVKWRIKDLEKLDELEWYRQSLAAGRLTAEMLEAVESDSPSRIDALYRDLEYCRENMDLLNVWVG